MAVIMVLPAWLILMMPQLIAGLSKLITSRVSLNKQNRYNSPIEQMRRIREAGLPFAAFEAGQAGSQSQLPDLSGFDQIGSAIGTGITQGNQMRMFLELLRRAGADADIAENLRDVSNEETKGLMSTVESDFTGMPESIASAGKVLDFKMKEYGVWQAKYKTDMEEIDSKIKAARFDSGQLQNVFDEEFEKLVNTNKSMRQLWQSNEAKNSAWKKIVNTMEKGGLSFFEALLIQVMSSMGGGISGGGVNLGF